MEITDITRDSPPENAERLGKVFYRRQSSAQRSLDLKHFFSRQVVQRYPKVLNGDHDVKVAIYEFNERCAPRDTVFTGVAYRLG